VSRRVIGRIEANKLINGKWLHKRKDPVTAVPPVSHATVPGQPGQTAGGSSANHRAGNCTYSSSEVRERFRVCPYNSFTDNPRAGTDADSGREHGTGCHRVHLVRQHIEEHFQRLLVKRTEVKCHSDFTPFTGDCAKFQRHECCQITAKDRMKRSCCTAKHKALRVPQIFAE
jgi:hypothetical protein